jgi:hypothetical protein
MQKSHQKLLNDLLEIIDFPITIDGTNSLA